MSIELWVIVALALLACSEDGGEVIQATQAAACSTTEQFIQHTKSQLERDYGRIGDSIGIEDSEKIYGELIVVTDEVLTSIVDCQIAVSRRSKPEDCSECLKEFAMELKGVRAYLVANQIGKESIAKQDIELIMSRIR